MNIKSIFFSIVLIFLTGCAGKESEKCRMEIPDPIKVSDNKVIIKGIYQSQFEVSSLSSSQYPSERIWLVPNYEIVKATEYGCGYGVSRGEIFNVILEGYLSEKGTFGHFGAYERTFGVEKVIKIERVK